MSINHERRIINHIDHSLFDELYAGADTITKMIIGFISYLKKSDYKGIKYNTADKPFTVEEPSATNYEQRNTNYALNS